MGHAVEPVDLLRRPVGPESSGEEQHEEISAPEGRPAQ